MRFSHAFALVAGLLAASCSLAQAAEPTTLQRLNVSVRDVSLGETIARVFTRAGVKVRLAPELAPIRISLTLKAVEEEYAVRMIVRQASKQVPDLEYESTDEGYRIFRGKPKSVPDEEKPLRYRSRSAPLGQPESSAPEGELEGGEFGFDRQLPRFGQGFAFYANSRGGYVYPFGTYMSPDGSVFSGNPAYWPGDRTPPNPDPYQTPVAGGGYSSLGRNYGNSNGKKKKPLPSFYDHDPQWILEPRMAFFGKLPPRAKFGKGGTGGLTPGGSMGGGYAPGNPFPVR